MGSTRQAHPLCHHTYPFLPPTASPLRLPSGAPPSLFSAPARRSGGVTLTRCRRGPGEGTEAHGEEARAGIFLLQPSLSLPFPAPTEQLELELPAAACDAPGFLISIISANDRINRVIHC
jgi:hypothetical protein